MYSLSAQRCGKGVVGTEGMPFSGKEHHRGTIGLCRIGIQTRDSPSAAFRFEQPPPLLVTIIVASRLLSTTTGLKITAINPPIVLTYLPKDTFIGIEIIKLGIHLFSKGTISPLSCMLHKFLLSIIKEMELGG